MNSAALEAARRSLAQDPPRARDGRPVLLHPLRADQESLLFDWQSDPGLRRWFRDPRPPAAQAHAAWIRQRLQRQDALTEVIHAGLEPCGVLRADPVAPGEYELSIYIAATHQQHGIAAAALAAAIRLLPAVRLLAQVHADNLASLRLFGRAGFEHRADQDAWKLLAREPRPDG